MEYIFYKNDHSNIINLLTFITLNYPHIYSFFAKLNLFFILKLFSENIKNHLLTILKNLIINIIAIFCIQFF